MKMKTVVVVVAFVLLLGVALFSAGRGKQSKGLTRISYAHVDPKAVDRIVLSGKNEAELKKEGEGWQLASGLVADAALVKQAVEAFPKIQSSDLVTTASEKHAQYEIDSAGGTRLQVFAGKKKVADVVIGKSAGGTYVRENEKNAVYLVTPAFGWQVVRPAGQWVRLSQFDVKIEDLEEVAVALAAAPAYALAQKDGEWSPKEPFAVPVGGPSGARPSASAPPMPPTADARLMRLARSESGLALPADFRFDKNAARGLAYAVIGLRASEVLAEVKDAAATGLGATDKPDRITFKTKDGKTYGFAMGKHEGNDEKKDIYAQVDGAKEILKLPQYAGTSLKKALTDLRDLRPMSLSAETAVGLKIAASGGKERIELAKKGDAWSLVKADPAAPAGFELDGEAVKRRISTLAEVRGAQLAPPSSAVDTGLGSPSATLTVTLAGGKTAKLAFGKSVQKESSTLYYATGNADRAVYLVPDYAHKTLTRGLDDLKKKPPPAANTRGLDPATLNSLPPEVREALSRQAAHTESE